MRSSASVNGWRHLRRGLASAGLLVACTRASVAFEWSAGTAQTEGFAADRLAAWQKDLAARQTKALLLIRHDRVVLEWYSPEHGIAKPHGTASMAKGLVGGVATAVALGDGRVALDEVAAKYIPRWRDDPRKSRITLRQLGSHTSGLADAEASGLAHEKLTGWQGDFWKRLPVPADPFTISRDLTPTQFEPGTAFQYSNPGLGMLAYALTAALHEAPERDLRTLLRDRVMRPIGIPDAEWSVGYGQTYNVDGLPLVAPWGGGSYTARAVARVGRLLLREGQWDGRSLLKPEAVHAVTRDAGTPGFGGIGFWSNQETACPQLPHDAFWASGAGHQVLLVVPSLDLLAVRNGNTLDPGNHEQALCAFFFTPLMGALVNPSPGSSAREPRISASSPLPAPAAPYPRSARIGGLTWAPKETVVRQAPGSDNWPMTWADDDAIYAAYGDGNGFQPFRTEKLSLGLARVTGAPPAFFGENLRAPTLEQRGAGPAGRKGSGLLSVGGVLYLLARNAGNAQLTWSADHGVTWSWADWKFTTSFGCPTFVNYGRDYSGARDEFVYVCSPDADSAYGPADGLVLARAPKARLHDGQAWQSVSRLDESGQPVWAADVAAPGRVFVHAGHCVRPAMTWNAGLKRYLLVMPVPTAASRDPRGARPAPVEAAVDTRFAGGLAIYDAPEPWGPWTTVYYTERWDIGPGDAASFPAKWMSADGRTMRLVFSGDDSFAVREARLEVTAKDGSPPRGSRGEYFPPPESVGGWRVLEGPDAIRRVGGMDPGKLEELKDWLRHSDERGFAAVVIRHGHVVLEVERGNSAQTDARRVASVSKAVCATVLAIASEQSQHGMLPRKMRFSDPAFDFIPWAQPLSDPRKAAITVRQLLNHTSGICPEATGAPNDGSWEYILGLTGDARTARLAFEPGSACGYSTHALHHAALVCETVTGKPYDQFAIDALFRPLGIEHWWFQYFNGGEKIGRHPTHGLGLPARDLARIAYCMLRNGRWEEEQVIPQWFVAETAAPTHEVRGQEMRWKFNAEVFSHGWELPARFGPAGSRTGTGIPADARAKPGSGGQYMAFVPSLDLVITRQTGGNGDWEYEEYLRRACAAVTPDPAASPDASTKPE